MSGINKRGGYCTSILSGNTVHIDHCSRIATRLASTPSGRVEVCTQHANALRQFGRVERIHTDPQPVALRLECGCTVSIQGARYDSETWNVRCDGDGHMPVEVMLVDGRYYADADVARVLEVVKG